MKIVNNTEIGRSVTVGGKDYFLAPGSYIEQPLTETEAEGLGTIFTLHGKPIKDAPAEKKEEEAVVAKKGGAK